MQKNDMHEFNHVRYLTLISQLIIINFVYIASTTSAVAESSLQDTHGGNFDFIKPDTYESLFSACSEVLSVISTME